MDPEDQKLLLNLTKAINLVYERPRKLFWRQFSLGIFSGLGATLGVAIVLAALSYLIHFLGGLPFIGDFVAGLSNALPKN